MLEDPDEGVRGRTVEELGKDLTTYAERRASVEDMINDPDPWVRHVAESKRQAAEAATAERTPPAAGWRWARGFARLTARSC